MSLYAQAKKEPNPADTDSRFSLLEESAKTWQI